MRVAAPATTARYVVVGPSTHGVVLHALRLAATNDELRSATALAPAAEGSAPPALLAAVPRGGAALLHVTDRLFGRTPEVAAEVLRGLASHATLALSLHDLPQPAEGGDWYARRRTTYGEFARVATRLVVASQFEARLLAECTAPVHRDAVARRTTVIPLPVERRREHRPGGPERPGPDAPVDIAVLGFLYPGKGVEEAIDAAASLRTPQREVTVTNYGAAAEGHADYAAGLARYAAQRGVRLRVTGYLSDDALHEAVLVADVPLAPHRHISASGSVNTWIESGRRPVVRRGPYVTELAGRLPGVVSPTDDLTTAVAGAIARPASTWLAAGVEVGPSWAEAAAAHADLLTDIGTG